MDSPIAETLLDSAEPSRRTRSEREPVLYSRTGRLIRGLSKRPTCSFGCPTFQGTAA